MSEGWLEYNFPKNFSVENNLMELKFSFEICSESPNYRMDYPSDLTVWINGVEILTFTSPGDFGGRRGKYSPEWWSEVSTQYGLLTTISIRENGAYFNENLVNNSVSFKDLNLSENQCIRFRIGNKECCKYKGGFNIFGKSFGDYNQDIIMEITLK